MKIPTHCPCCNSPLSNSFLDLGRTGRDLIRKQCHQINHKFTCQCNDSVVFAIGVELDPSEGTFVTWNFLTRKISLRNPRKTNLIPIDIPWFEPDLTDYKSLIKKLKTYMCFA